MTTWSDSKIPLRCRPLFQCDSRRLVFVFFLRSLRQQWKAVRRIAGWQRRYTLGEPLLRQDHHVGGQTATKLSTDRGGPIALRDSQPVLTVMAVLFSNWGQRKPGQPSFPRETKGKTLPVLPGRAKVMHR